MQLKGTRILVTGASGVLGLDLAQHLAQGNTVYGLARFSDPTSLDLAQAAGIIPVKRDLATDPLGDLPDDIDIVFNLGATTADFDRDQPYTYRANAMSVGRLMQRWPKVKAFVHASTSAVYRHQPRALRETDPIGAEFETYSTSKFAGEMIGTFASELWDVPSIYLRIFQAFGPRGGRVTSRIKLIAENREVVLHPDAAGIATPHYISDFVRFAINAVDHAAVPPTVVNTAGIRQVNAQEYIRFIGELLGVKPRVVSSASVPRSGYADTTLMRTLLGEPQVSLEEGIRKVIKALYPNRAIGGGRLAYLT